MAKSNSICSIEGCSKSAEKRGWCGAHYLRWRKYGDPLVTKRTPRHEASRFYNEVVLAYDGKDCLIWPFARFTVNGYAKMRRDGKAGVVSRFLCEDIYGPPPTPEHEAAHGCGKGHEGCVAKSHLRWATSLENKADKIFHGTSLRGEKNHRAKLSESQVLEIFSLRGVVTQRLLGERFGVSEGTIQLIHDRKNWSWLTE